jgi:ribosome biogenesis protein YTM1
VIPGFQAFAFTNGSTCTAYASGSHDCTARVWSRLGGAVDDKGAAAGGSKVKKGTRRKGEEGADADAAAAIEGETPALLTPLGAEVVLTGHKDSVSAVAWETSDIVWSGSFDHTLKCWDAESGQVRQSFDTPKAGGLYKLNPVDPLSLSPHLRTASWMM